MTLEPIFDPRKRRPAPSPARVDLRIIFAAGTIIFAVLAIAFMAASGGHASRVSYKFWICLFGFIIGLVMLVWERFNRSTYMKLANDDETINGLGKQADQDARTSAQADGTPKQKTGMAQTPNEA